MLRHRTAIQGRQFLLENNYRVSMIQLAEIHNTDTCRLKTRSSGGSTMYVKRRRSMMAVCISLVLMMVSLSIVNGGSPLVSSSNAQAVDRGVEVTISCNVSGDVNISTTEVSWNGPNGQLNETDRTTTQDLITSTIVITNTTHLDGGTYTCSASSNGTTVSMTTFILINPVIEPNPLTTRYGENQVLTCEVQPSLMSNVRWYKLDGEILSPIAVEGSGMGSGSGMMLFAESMLTFDSVVYADQGMYQCAVTSDEFNETFSKVATLVVSPEGNISVTPLDQVFNRTSNVTLTCSTSGGPDNQYQWLRGEETISSSSSLMLTTPIGGEYTCIVTNLAGTENATTNVFVNLDFTLHPIHTSAVNGTMLTLVCEAESFPEPVYQWFRDSGENIGSNVMGVNSNVLVFNPVQFGDEGNYFCTATSNNTSINSTTALLSLSPGDLTIMDDPSNTLMLGDNVTFTCSALGGPDNMFQWQKDGQDLIGETQSMLILTNVNSSDGGVYTCVVNNTAGSGNVNTTLYVVPYFTMQPIDTIASNGSSASLSCEAEAFPDPTYQWFRIDGQTISNSVTGVNSSMLVFNPVQFGDEGDYYCTATSFGNNVNSTSATLRVSPGELTIMADPSTPLMFGDNVTFTCSALGGPDNMFQWQKDGQNLLGETQSMLTLTNINALNGGVYTCVVNNTAGSGDVNTTLYVVPYFTMQPIDTITSNGSSASLSCEAESFPDPAYQWFRIDGQTISNSVTGVNSNMLVFNPVQFGDEGDYYCTATSFGNNVNSTSATLRVSPGELTILADPSTPLMLGDNVTFTCSALGGPNMFQWQKDGQDLLGETESMLTLTNVNASDGGVYTCVVNNTAGSGDVNTTLYVVPYFTVQPVDTITSNGSSDSLSSEAEAFPDPTYQWFRIDGQTISNNVTDVNSSMLVFNPIQFGDEGDYYCTATSFGNNFNSTSATLIVSPGSLNLVTDPSTPLMLGDNVTFTCSALGGPDNMFQWQKDGLELLGETQSMLTLTNVNASDGGVYTCVVNNTAGNEDISSTLYVLPYFTLQPSDVTLASNGSTQTVTCVAEAFPEPTYQWLRSDSKELSTNVMGLNSSTLMFSPVLFGDEGDYYCTAVSNNLIINSTTATLIVSPGNLMIETDPSNTLMLGDNVTFTCSAMGGPDNMFQWQKDEQDIINETLSNLVVREVNADDGGVYTCVVYNIAGNDSVSETLYIMPYFVLQPNDTFTSNGSIVNFICQAEAFPEPVYQWYRADGQEISSNVMGANTSTLVFNSVLFGDEGNYFCTATSDIISTTVNSSVATLTISPEGSVTATPSTTNNVLGDNQMFTCNALGGPGNVFTWTRLYDNVFVGNMSTLIVSVEGATDGGMYTCDVENNAGNDSDTVTLNVGPVIDMAPVTTNITSTEIGTIICSVSGFPVPTISWTHNGTEFQEDENRTVLTETAGDRSIVSSLTIRMAMTNDSGEYVCNASSPSFMSVRSDPALVLVQDTPEQPQNVTAVTVATTNIVLTWVEPHDNNAPILGYRISYNQPDFLGGGDMTVNSSVEMVNITGLRPGVSYSFTVIAFNNIGVGAPSDVNVVTTVEEVPSGAPRNVTTEVISSTEIRVSWNKVPEMDRNGIITTYEVLYDPLMTFGVLTPATVNTTNLSIIVSGLEEFVEYNISVRAYTSVGPGPYSEEVTERTFENEPASSPQNISTEVLSSTEIRVLWTEVPDIDRNGIISTYEVLYEPLMTFDDVLTPATVNTTNLSIIVSGLEEFVEYNISVRAYTSVGPGPYSEEVTERTFENEPASSPQNISTEVLSSTEIRVLWTGVPVIDSNGIITTYEVLYGPLMTFGNLTAATVNTTNLSIIVSGLEEFVEYNISVRAYTSVGPGPYTEEVTERTFEDEPASPPTNISIDVLSSTEIRVSWAQVFEIDRNGIINTYEVLYEPLMTFGVLTPATVNTTNLSIIVNGLEEFVEYNISVRAYTSVGPGPYSEGINATTSEDEPASPPTNISLDVLLSTEIRVSWNEVAEIIQNGIITTYEVLYEPLMTFGVLAPATVNTTNLSIIVSGLEEFVEYNISVRAYTSVGPGPYSEEITDRTLEDVPAASPTNVQSFVLSSTEVSVSWSEVPEIDRNGIITMYEVMYEKVSDLISGTVNISNVSMFSVNVTNLEEFEVYNISVRAYTDVGPGLYSVPEQMVMTLSAPPGPVLPPPMPNMSEITATSVVVSWNKPEDANGVVLNYTVEFVAVELVSTLNTKRRKRQAVNTLMNCIVGGDSMINRSSTVPGNQTSATLTDLTPYTVYEFRVQAATDAGIGDFSNSTRFSTMESVPSQPSNLMVNYQTDNSSVLEVSWSPPLCDNGVRIQYTLDYSAIEPDGVLGSPLSGMNLTASTTTVTITGLTPNTGYNVSVSAWTGAGQGNTNTTLGMTNEEAPPAVTNLAITSIATTSIDNVNITISWTSSSSRNGPFNYLLSYIGTQPPAYAGALSPTQNVSVVLDDNEESTTEYMFNNGLPTTMYSVTVTAVNIKTGLASPEIATTDTTVPIRPSEVTNLKAVAMSSVSILVTWDLPEFPNGPILRYIVNYRETDLTSASFNDLPTSPGQQQQEQLMISGLKAFTNYTIFVQAVGDSGLVGPDGMQIIQRTNSTAPPVVVVPTDTPTPEPTTNTIVYNLPPANFTTGPLQFYGVIVVLNPGSNTDFSDAGPFTSGAQYYIAAAWDNPDNVPTQLKVGDGTTTVVRGVEYVNVALNAGTSYGLLVRVEIESDNGEPLVTFSSLMTVSTPLAYSPAGVGIGIILLIAAIAALVVGIVVGLLWYRNRYYVAKVQGYADNDLEFEQNSGQFTQLNVFHNTAVVHMGTLEPIPVSQFKAHVQKMHANDDYLFSEEYANVEPSHAPSTEATHNPHNTAKNRYANIPSYDHSRVKLFEIPNRPGSDYINGNYIDGYHQSNAFIATQGPVPDSVSDFWRMVWEQGSAVIVMLTNLQEKGRIKCHQYWPDDKGGMYGSIRVHIQEILTLADYTVRTFSMQKEGSKEERIVTQFHFTVWPDHGVPEYPTPLLHFVRKVATSNPTNAGPIVVHCSAGVGRTGTFITLFTQLKKIRAENMLDIFGFVKSMRYNRCCMVQTELQYVFIHDALLEAIECGVHEVAARDLKEQYKRLGVLDPKLGLTKLESEFDNLDSTVHRRPSKSIGTLQINKSKNRYTNTDMIPYDITRCRLSFIPGVDGSDYINANLISGYHKRRAFIATQAPLPDTGDDFWRMIWERQTATIVMLTREREGGRVKCHRYWPSTGAENFGTLQVILHAVNEYPDYTLREFKIIDTKDSSSLPVKQFQYTGWPEEGVPDSGSGLIDLIGQVQKWQRSSGDKPVVVHCSGGTGRTGTFIAVSVLLERLKTEGVVDVFHTVRGLRLQRPAMVQSVDQYEFVYKTVLEYLDSFELYANFK